jgi:hypothetical protein
MDLTLANARMAVRAAWGVSTSPPMPRFQEYVARLEPRAVNENPERTLFGRAIRARVAGTSGAHRQPLFLPWSPRQKLATQRLFAAVVSFVDDYNGPYPDELFPRAPMAALIDVFATSPRSSLDLVAQFDRALTIVGPHPFAAAVALHGAVRTLARGRDRRLGSPFDLSLEERVARGASVAPFARELGPHRDALGDTYHYWGCFSIGMHCGVRLDDPARWALLGLTGAGADLMALVRSGVFAHPLFCGNHAAVDRAGLTHGFAAARALARGETQ